MLSGCKLNSWRDLENFDNLSGIKFYNVQTWNWQQVNYRMSFQAPPINPVFNKSTIMMLREREVRFAAFVLNLHHCKFFLWTSAKNW